MALSATNPSSVFAYIDSESGNRIDCRFAPSSRYAMEMELAACRITSSALLGRINDGEGGGDGDGDEEDDEKADT